MNQSIQHVEDLGDDLFGIDCSSCGKTVEVSPKIQQFNEVLRGTKIAYYGPRRSDRLSTLAGVSEPGGRNFECLACHSKKWLKNLRGLA